jgi:type III secretory pathway component EscV
LERLLLLSTPNNNTALLSAASADSVTTLIKQRAQHLVTTCFAALQVLISLLPEFPFYAFFCFCLL